MTKHLATLERSLGHNKGAPRVWLEGILPARAGFVPGARYNVRSDDEKRVVLTLDPRGIRLVSSKTKADRQLPVIDLNSHELLARFEGMNVVRVVLLEGEIHILPHAIELKKRERAERLTEAIATGTITTASVSHGAGVMSHAMHEGLKGAGLNPKLLWACEIDDAVLDQAAMANPCWGPDTTALGMPLQHLAFADDYTLNRIPKPVLLEAGLPCTAASLSGRAKKGLAKAEDDPDVGHLVAAFIALIARVNPSAIVLENVEPWFATASASILRTQLRELGYVLEEKVIEGGHYAIEARVRQVLVAVTEGVELDLASMVAPTRTVETVAAILEPVPEDDPQWSAMEYLKAKELRDKADGKGFAMQRITPEATRVGCIGRGYMKRRSTEPMLAHPTSPDLLRLFTPIEHARLKGIPTELIEGVESKTFAHELLGQSCVWPAFRHLGEVLGLALQAFKTRRDDAPPPFALASAA